jgi:glucokinase
VDIGGTKVALMVSNVGTGQELARDRFPTPTDLGPEAMIEQLGEAIGKVVDEADRPRSDLRAVGVAVPGPVDPSDGRVILAGNLKGWTDVPLRARLCRGLDVPVWVEEDANAAAIGERWRGCATSLRTFVFLALGTGIGAGIIVDGRLHHGAHNMADEVGNFLMGREYLGRDRGGHGNLERLIGSPAIKERAKRDARQDLPAGAAIAGANGDRRLEAVAERVSDYLTIAVVNIAVFLDPEAIILGGGTAAAGDDLLDRLRPRVEQELRTPPALMHSALGEDAQLHGATFGALEQIGLGE